MSQLDDLFEDLCGLMQQEGNTGHWVLSKLLRRAIQTDETRYRGEWLPYLKSCALPIFFVENLEDTRLFSRMLP